MSERTTSKFAENAKYADWFEKYNPKDCSLNRQEYTKFLANYITSEQDGFVLNLNGSWGTGKTYFLKRLYTHLLSEKGHPTIYIDAWESDFTNNPLQVVCSELLEQLTALNSNVSSMSLPLKKLFGSVLKGTTIAAATYFGDKISQKDAAVEAVKSMWDSAPDEMVDRLSAEYQEQVTAIKKIREELTGLAETLAANCSAKTPVIVLIDELDRCRPNYAIELLEVVKHFFTTEKFVFVIASDTKQLRESIKTIYGDKFDSEIYLRRFFNRQATLPKPRIIDFISTLYPNLAPTEGYQRIGFKDENDFYRQLAKICEHHDFSLRDIEQVISKYTACKSQIPNCTIYSPTKLLVMLADNHAKNGSNTCETRFVSYNCIDRAINDGSKLNSDIISSPDQSPWSEDRDMIIKWIDDVKEAQSNANYTVLSDEEYKNLIELSGTLTGMEAQ